MALYRELVENIELGGMRDAPRAANLLGHCL
jgi:hypothetical protein